MSTLICLKSIDFISDEIGVKNNSENVTKVKSPNSTQPAKVLHGNQSDVNQDFITIDDVLQNRSHTFM